MSCKYHPGTQALWYCHHDGLSLCQQCVEVREQDPTRAWCLLCRSPLAEARPGEGQGALWQQLDRYLRLPLALPLLPVLLIWALVAALLPVQWFSLPLAVLGGLPAYAFAAALMAKRGRGRPGRRQSLPGWEVLGQGRIWRRAGYLALPAVLVLTCAGLLLAGVSPVAGLLVGALGLLPVPALWVAVTVEEGGAGAYGAALKYIFTSPVDYLVVALFASVSWLLAVGLVSVGLDLLPGFIARALAGALAGLWWLALAALCGDLIKRHARDWGYGRPVTAMQEPLAQRRLRLQLCAGRFDKALATVQPGPKASLSDWQYYDRLLGVLNRDEERQQRAEDYLEVLVRNQAWPEARRALARQRQSRAGWLPHSPALRLQLARGLHEDAPKLAVQLLNNLHHSDPDFSEIGEAYLLLARILAEPFQRPDKAQQYLRFVESHCRSARLRKQVAEYRAAWD